MWPIVIDVVDLWKCDEFINKTEVGISEKYSNRKYIKRLKD